MEDYIYRNFELRWGNILDIADEIYKGRYMELLIKTKDGKLFSYYDVDDTIRRVFMDYENPTEHECKRDFGIRLGQMIARRHLTQEILADKTGLSRVIINRYVNGKSAPGVYNLRLITRALNCSPDDLMIW